MTTVVPRRQVLGRAPLWGGAGAAAAAIDAGLAFPASAHRPRVVYDVACLGETFRVIWAPGAPDSGDLRGSTFSVAIPSSTRGSQSSMVAVKWCRSTRGTPAASPMLSR
jgi:hypothetical protein